MAATFMYWAPRSIDANVESARPKRTTNIVTMTIDHVLNGFGRQFMAQDKDLLSMASSVNFIPLILQNSTYLLQPAVTLIGVKIMNLLK
jgi:hypothetical protein